MKSKKYKVITFFNECLLETDDLIKAKLLAHECSTNKIYGDCQVQTKVHDGIMDVLVTYSLGKEV